MARTVLHVMVPCVALILFTERLMGAEPLRASDRTVDPSAAPTRNAAQPKSNVRRSQIPAEHYTKFLNSSNDKARERGIKLMLRHHADHPEVPGLLIDAVNQARRSNTVTAMTLWMIRTLGGYNQPRVAGALIGWLGDAVDSSLAGDDILEIITTLANLDRPEVQDALISLLEAKDYRVVMLAVEALGHMQCAKAVEPIQSLVRRPEYSAHYGFRWSVLQSLCQMKSAAAVGFLVGQLPSLSGQLKFGVVDYLTRVTGQRFGGNTRHWMDWWNNNGRQDFRYSTTTASRPGDYEWDYPVPTFYDEKIYGTRVIFVIDISSTMTRRIPRGGITRLEQAKRELAGAIARLPSDAVFNIIAFDRSVHMWQPASVPMTPQSRANALQTTAALRSGHGTAIYDALEAAFRADDNAEVIFLLSDGEPTSGKVTSPEEIARIVTRENRFRKITINTIAVGQRSPLLKKLSSRNNGSCRESG